MHLLAVEHGLRLWIIQSTYNLTRGNVVKSFFKEFVSKIAENVLERPKKIELSIFD